MAGAWDEEQTKHKKNEIFPEGWLIWNDNNSQPSLTCSVNKLVSHWFIFVLFLQQFSWFASYDVDNNKKMLTISSEFFSL